MNSIILILSTILTPTQDITFDTSIENNNYELTSTKRCCNIRIDEKMQLERIGTKRGGKIRIDKKLQLELAGTKRRGGIRI